MDCHNAPDCRTIVVRFYGRLADEFQPELMIPVSLGPLTVGELRELLSVRHSAGAVLGPSVKVAIGDQIVRDDYIVEAGVDVEFLAPLSGG